MMTVGRSLAKWKRLSTGPMSWTEFVVHDADDLLAGIERSEHVLAERLLGDALDEVVGDVEIDVGLEQGGADLLQALLDVGLGEPASACADV